MAHLSVLMLVVLFAVCCISVDAYWWVLGSRLSASGTASMRIMCRAIPGLSNKQLKICRRNREIMPEVAEGAKMGIDECQSQFANRRWNCSVVDENSSVFGPVLSRGSREAAFVHAIASAGVVHAVTRACSAGNLSMCGCDYRPKGPPGDDWQWGGCDDDVYFGMEFAKLFIDAKETGRSARAHMNKHNNGAGRQAVLNTMKLECKCHGISGSCEVKTCWYQQAPFSELGVHLKEKYNSAAEMVVSHRQQSEGDAVTLDPVTQDPLEPKYQIYKAPTKSDLIYFEESPDYCVAAPELGVLGTQGRSCNASSYGIDGCDLLCCGRGYTTRTVVERRRCFCKFYWCCYVRCKSCRYEYEESTCS